MKQKHIQHLFWRANFGIGFKDLQKNKLKSKSKLVAELFSESKFYPLELDLSEFSDIKLKSNKELKEIYTIEELSELRKKSRQKVRDLNYIWLDRLVESKALLREKMTLFWANVFVCRDNNNIFFIQRYNNTLRRNALGDFRQFVKEIAKEPSMSKYLNNRQNIKKKPNENFARELMELFTLGAGNYTEQDIKESARAFTGWSFKKNGDFQLRKKQHDFGEKTFFCKTGNFTGEDIIDIILEQKQCARFICDKVYKYFVNPKVDERRLEEITNIFYKDYDIGNLMKHIFMSNWFYDEANIGVKIKSPIELFVGIQKIVPVTFNKPKQLNYLQKMMGQVLLYPVNVAGWKGGKSWIDSNTLMFRMKLASLILNNAVINLEEKGEFEDTFEKYYKNAKRRNKFIKTTKNWEVFDLNCGELKAKELGDFLILSKIDKDTETLINGLEIKSNRNFCVQLMSIPEYQLC